MTFVSSAPQLTRRVPVSQLPPGLVLGQDMHVGATEEEFGARFASGDWGRSGGNLQSMGFALAALAALPAGTIPLTGTLLDYGCAMGDGTAVLATVFPTLTVTGCDISADAVRLAQARWPTLRFLKDDIEHPTQTADVIWTSHTLEHLADPKAVVEELLRRCHKLVAIFPPMLPGDDIGPHHGSPMTSSWLPYLPDPVFHTRYHTCRVDPTAPVTVVMEEPSLLLVWAGTLEEGT